jgi:hypothetical protein
MIEIAASELADRFGLLLQAQEGLLDLERRRRGAVKDGRVEEAIDRRVALGGVERSDDVAPIDQLVQVGSTLVGGVIGVQRRDVGRDLFEGQVDLVVASSVFQKDPNDALVVVASLGRLEVSKGDPQVAARLKRKLTDGDRGGGGVGEIDLLRRYTPWPTTRSILQQGRVGYHQVRAWQPPRYGQRLRANRC